MPENIFFNGDIFGIIDNGILALLSVFGIDIEKRLVGQWIPNPFVEGVSWMFFC